MTDNTPYSVPKEPGRWRAITLAVAVHAMLLVFLWVGIRWQNEKPIAVEAEVWSPQTREAAPRPLPAEAKKPEPKIEPPPQIKTPPKVVVEPPVVKPPDIALEQEKKRKALAEKKQREATARQKKIEERRLAKEKAEAQEKLRAEEMKKAVAEKKRKQEVADAKILEETRAAEMRRISGVTSTSNNAGNGDAPKSQGRTDAGYGQRLMAKIKSHTIFVVPQNLSGNPSVKYSVELFPDGLVRSIRKLESSHLPGFDEAVERAVRDAAPYPADKSGTVPPSFIFSHKPKNE